MSGTWVWLSMNGNGAWMRTPKMKSRLWAVAAILVAVLCVLAVWALPLRGGRASASSASPASCKGTLAEVHQRGLSSLFSQSAFLPDGRILLLVSAFDEAGTVCRDVVPPGGGNVRGGPGAQRAA